MSCPITVHVNFYGVLREMTGKKSDQIVLESTSLKDLLTILIRTHENALKSLSTTVENFSSQFSIFVNRLVVPSEKIHEVALKQGDEIDLFTPVSGG